MTRKCPTESSR